jgi:hypothetical protein
MNFGLINTRENFQRAMDIAFVGERDKFIVTYLNDIIVFSKIDEDHIKILRQAFVKCRSFGLSLNPQKPYFAMEEGKLLGHIVSKEGVKKYPKRVEETKQITHPRTRKKYNLS